MVGKETLSKDLEARLLELDPAEIDQGLEEHLDSNLNQLGNVMSGDKIAEVPPEDEVAAIRDQIILVSSIIAERKGQEVSGWDIIRERITKLVAEDTENRHVLFDSVFFQPGLNEADMEDRVRKEVVPGKVRDSRVLAAGVSVGKIMARSYREVSLTISIVDIQNSLSK